MALSALWKLGAILVLNGLLGNWLAHLWNKEGYPFLFQGMVVVGGLLVAGFFTVKAFPSGFAIPNPAPAGARINAAAVRANAAAVQAGNVFARWLSALLRGIGHLGVVAAAKANQAKLAAKADPEKTALIASTVLLLVLLAGWLASGRRGWSYALAVSAIVLMAIALTRWNKWGEVRKYWDITWLALSFSGLMFAIMASWSGKAIFLLASSAAAAGFCVVCNLIGWKKVGDVARKIFFFGYNIYATAIGWFLALASLAWYIGMMDQYRLVRLRKTWLLGEYYLPRVSAELILFGAAIAGIILGIQIFRRGAAFVRDAVK